MNGADHAQEEEAVVPLDVGGGGRDDPVVVDSESDEASSVVSGLSDDTASDEDERTIICQDGVRLTARDTDLKAAGVYRVCLDTEDDPGLLPSPFSSEHTKLILAYLEHHKGNPAEAPLMPLRADTMGAVCSDPWDARFVNGIFHEKGSAACVLLSRHADFFGIPQLQKLCAARVAMVAVQMSAPELREMVTAQKPKKKAGKRKVTKKMTFGDIVAAKNK